MSEQPFPLILITSPEDFADEVVLVETMFRRGLQRLHLRKPRHDARSLQRWLLGLSPEFRAQVVLHGHPELVQDFGLAGIHGILPEYMRCEGTHSASVHSFSELSTIADGYNYLFLSPIFDSYSKTGYSAAFSADEIQSELAAWNTIFPAKTACYALGGVDAECLPRLVKWGFAGAAVLGAVWNSMDPLRAWDELYQTSFVVHGLPAPEHNPIESWREIQAQRRGDGR